MPRIATLVAASIACLPLGATQQVLADEQKGQDAYATYCIGCHQFDGKGIPGVYPALAGSALVTVDAKVLARLILDGGFANTIMPKYRDVLDAATAAAILTYIRSNWGNKASPVAPQDVPARTNE